MFCPTCGSQLADNAQFCPKCGHAFTSPKVTENKSNGIEAVDIVAFLIPIIGFVMYFVWKDDKPEQAKKVCSATVIGFIFWFVISMLGLV